MHSNPFVFQIIVCDNYQILVFSNSVLQSLPRVTSLDCMAFSGLSPRPVDSGTQFVHFKLSLNDSIFSNKFHTEINLFHAVHLQLTIVPEQCQQASDVGVMITGAIKTKFEESALRSFRRLGPAQGVIISLIKLCS